MPLNTEQIVSVVQTIMEKAGIKATLVEITKNTLAVGICTTVGGIFGGPIGLSIGGCLGSIIALKRGNGKYKSVPEIMKTLSPDQRTGLAKSVENIFRDLNVSDIKMAVALIMANNSLHTKLLSSAVSFLQTNLGFKLAKS